MDFIKLPQQQKEWFKEIYMAFFSQSLFSWQCFDDKMFCDDFLDNSLRLDEYKGNSENLIGTLWLDMTSDNNGQLRIVLFLGKLKVIISKATEEEYYELVGNLEKIVNYVSQEINKMVEEEGDELELV